MGVNSSGAEALVDRRVCSEQEGMRLTGRLRSASTSDMKQALTARQKDECRLKEFELTSH